MGKKLEGPNFTAWAKSLKMLMYMYPVECHYRYNIWHIINGELLYSQEEFADIGLDEDEWYEANYFALLTMKRNCEEEPLGLIELCDYAFEAYEILMTHYENRMVSDLGVIISGVTKSNYSENITIEAHFQDFEQKWKKMATIGNVDEDNQEFAEHIQGIGRLESAKKEFLLMTFPTHIPRYAQLVQNIRSQRGYSYGDVVANLKIYVPQIGWKKKSHQGAWTGSKTDPVVLKGTTEKTCGYCIKVKGWRGIGHTESECRTKKRERSNQDTGVKKIDNKPYEESEDDFELDQGARITEVNRVSQYSRSKNPRVHMIKAGKLNNRTGQYEFDTGAQVHTTNELWRLQKDSLKPGRTITACNGTKTTAIYEGTLKMKHNGRDIILKNVLYHPSFYNLISGQRIPGIELRNLEGLKVLTNGEILYSIEQDAGTMWIKLEDTLTNTYVSVNKVTLMDLHERYGHISFDTLKSLPEALPLRGKTNPPVCEACIKGKSTKPPARKAEKQVRSNKVLERLHTDLIGPFSKEWLGKKYVLTAMDDYSRYCTAIPIKAKSDTKGALREWIKMLETQCKEKVVYLQADWGGEFRNTELALWCKKKGIQMKETVSRHSETNAIIERLNRTLQDMARTVMISSGLKLWGDAIQWAAYTKNRIPHKAIKQSPIEALLGRKIDRSNLRPFGQKVMIHLYKEERKDRMAPRAQEARITGYTITHGVYQVITTTGKRTIAKNPKPVGKDNDSDEEDNTPEWPRKPIQDLEDIADGQPGQNYGWHCPEEKGCPEGTHVEQQLPQTPEPPQTPERQRDPSPKLDSPSQQLFREQKEPPSAPQKPIPVEPRRSERMGRDTTNWQDRIKQGLAGESYKANRVGHDDDHPTDEQARSGPKAYEWANARKTEREKLQTYGVYTIVQKHEIPEDIHPVDTKWVYDVKKDNAGNITRYRARKVGEALLRSTDLTTTRPLAKWLGRNHGESCSH